MNEKKLRDDKFKCEIYRPKRLIICGKTTA